MRSYHEKNLSRIALVLVISLFLSGCAGNVPFIGKKQDGQGEMSLTAGTLGLEPDFSYEIKAEKPSVQVDSLGYLPKSTKTAVFQGKELPEVFRIMEKGSGECVYEGKVRKAEEAADDVLTGYGNFTELEKEGTYYIECEKIGCSYYFDIGKEVYLEKAREFSGIIEQMREKEALETADICEAVSYLLVAYEMYPGLITEIWGDGKAEEETPELTGEAFFRMLRRETDLLLSMQDEIAGGIYGNTAPTEDQEASAEATAAFAGTMAKYGYLYQQYDWDYANTCLKAAAKAWRYLNSSWDILQDETVQSGFFYAASELYRASNETVYHNYILQNQEALLSLEEDFYLLMGKVTYLSTRRKVNHDLCGQIIDELMKEAESMSVKAKEGLFLVEGKETDVILWNMTVMALANYAIMNHEYVTVIENSIHYLFGRNESAEFMLEDPECREAAGMLLLLSVAEMERQIVEASESEE